MTARAWGCESLSELERAKKILDAGCDQFGGETRTDLVVRLVEDGLVPESRIDQSVSRIWQAKFVLGLFDNPFVDEEAALQIVRQPGWKKEGEQLKKGIHSPEEPQQYPSTPKGPIFGQESLN
jgi:beta-glucosidase-like glycosyl hydrolase